MAMRWKKDPAVTGLARICAGPRGSALRINGDIRVATVNVLGRSNSKGWFWVAGWGHADIPHKNTCKEPRKTEEEAKAEATQYVRKCLEAAAKSRKKESAQ